MKENSGSETHLKRCKLSSILDLLGLGCSLRSVTNKNAQLRTEDSINLNPKISKKMRKPVKPFNTVKVKSLGIQLKTELASVKMTLSVFMMFLS
jgi:hypothetical protein